MSLSCGIDPQVLLELVLLYRYCYQYCSFSIAEDGRWDKQISLP